MIPLCMTQSVTHLQPPDAKSWLFKYQEEGQFPFSILPHKGTVRSQLIHLLPLREGAYNVKGNY